MMTIPSFGIKGYTLNEACRNDMSYVIGCVKGCILSSVPESEAELSDLWISDILRICENGIYERFMSDEVFILRDEYGINLGMLWMGVSKDEFTCDDTGYLLGIYVEKGLRGRGFGKALMDSAEEWCRKKGFLSLTLNVGAANTKALALYDSLGYTPRTTVLRKNLF